MAPRRTTEPSLCAAVTQHSGTELRLKAVVLRGLSLSADSNINSGPLQRLTVGQLSLHFNVVKILKYYL